MGNIKVGDIVARRSYGADILFRVAEISKSPQGEVYVLHGICYRIQADAHESDLLPQTDQRVLEYTGQSSRMVEQKTRQIHATSALDRQKKVFTRSTPKENSQDFFIPGRVLHLDGDQTYLNSCLEQYKKFGIDVTGKYIHEKEQAQVIYRLLQETRPDILVLTGHDAYAKDGNAYQNLDNYANSKYFIAAVREARRYNPDMDSLVIFAGACQSNYSQIINAGANYASAPYRVLIHALDPVFICQKIAFSSAEKFISPQEVIRNTITGTKGFGGVQTRGKYRNGFPSEPFQE